MKAATVQEIKNELLHLKQQELVAIATRLARFKKENKELLTYLLFESTDEEGYVRSVKLEIDELMATVNKSHVYFAKKTIRKILRLVNKYARYSNSKQTEIELLVYFCQQVKQTGISLKKNTALNNLFQNQLLNIRKLMKPLHEDIQYDFYKALEDLGE
jgi:hypothetical protein